MIVVTLIAIGLVAWWFVATKDERARQKQYDNLLFFSKRQAVEIKIIEQSAKLEQYKQLLAQKSKPADPNEVKK